MSTIDTDYKLHPKDYDFLNSLYNFNNTNNNTTPIYQSLYNSIKKRSTKSTIELLLNIINKVDYNISTNLLKLIISLFRYDNYTKYNIETKLISTTEIRTLINNNLSLLQYIDNKTLSYYEILIYSQTKYTIDISDVVTLSDIDTMTNLYLDKLHSLDYTNDLIDILEYYIRFPLYHINYINLRDDYDFTNINYHLLYLKLTKYSFINNNKDLIELLLNNIYHTAKWVCKILDNWLNISNDVIDIDNNISTYLEYQMDIIEFLSLSNNHNFIKYINHDIPNELIECFGLFQTNYYKLINNNIFNIYTRSRIIELNHENNAWNDTNNIETLLNFYILLEKYNDSTGFDSRDRIRFFICKILTNIINNLNIISNIAQTNTILFYKFLILLINSNYRNIEFFKTFSSTYNERNIHLINSINIEFYTLSMQLICKMILLLSFYLTDKWLNYIIYDIILWWDSNINLWSDDDVSYMVLDITYTDNSLLEMNKMNFYDFFTNFISISNDLWNNYNLQTKWILYSSSNITNINEFIQFVKTDIPSINIDNFKNSINTIYDTSNNIDNLNTSNIPNEFIDPLVCVLIENPVEIPVSCIIVDEKIIYKHIVIKGDNPFNRMPLSIEELIKYQEQDDVQKRINDWKIRYNDWLNPST